MRDRTGWTVMLIVAALFITLGCSLSGLIGRPQPVPTPTRTPRPTFTPTPVTPDLTEMQPVVQPTVQQEQPTPTPEPPTPTLEPPTPTPIPTPFVVVNEDIVNLRAGPGTNYPAVGKTQAGQTFVITGKNPAGDWWEICCVGDKRVWIYGQMVRPGGAVDTVQVAQNIPPPPPTPRPRPTTPPPPTPTPAPQYAFNATGVEPRTTINNLVTVWGRVFNQNRTQAFGGYKLRILRGGATVAETTTDDRILHGDPGLGSQFMYNAKIEIYNYSGGQYTAQLLDSGGQPAGPDQAFTVSGETRIFLIEWLKR